MSVKKGRFYRLIQSDSQEFSKKRVALSKQNAEFFLVMRSIDCNTSLCIPIVKSSHSYQVALKLNDIDYFANYLVFLTIPNVLLEETNAYYHNSYQLVDQIYRKSKAHNNQVAKHLRKKRKKARQKQEEIRRDNQYLREMSYEKKSLTPSDRPPSTVTWRMSHPAQGGRTSPR